MAPAAPVPPLCLQILSTHGHTLSAPLWQALYTSAVAPVLALPPADAAGAVAPTAFAAVAGIAALAAREPSAAAEAGGGGSRRASGAPGLSASVSRTSTFGGGAAALVAVPPLGALSPEGLFRLERHASAHMRDLWGLVVENYSVAGSILLPQVGMPYFTRFCVALMPWFNVGFECGFKTKRGWAGPARWHHWGAAGRALLQALVLPQQYLTATNPNNIKACESNGYSSLSPTNFPPPCRPSPCCSSIWAAPRSSWLC